MSNDGPDIRHHFVTEARIGTRDSPLESPDLICTVNEEISSVSRKRKYAKWTPEQRAEIGAYAQTHGDTRALKRFIKTYPSLTRQTAGSFKKQYIEQLKLRGKDSGNVLELHSKKRGRKTLLPDDVIGKSIDLLDVLRKKGAISSRDPLSEVWSGVFFVTIIPIWIILLGMKQQGQFSTI